LFERFTDRARRVVVLAQEEARLLNHNYIGTEHILLGLIHEGEGVAAKALESLGISLEAVRNQVEEIIGQGGSSPSGHIPFTPRAKKVLELSLREALQLGHNYIGTEHILLGLIREGEGVAAQVLTSRGAGLARVRAKVFELLSVDPGPAEREAVTPTVFIVSGAADEATGEVAGLIESLAGRPPVVLRGQPDGGRAIISAFTERTHPAIVVVVLSGTDEGRTRDPGDEQLQPRASQNVVYEMGWFRGRLGRTVVIALIEDGVDVPTDATTVTDIRLDAEGTWRDQLGRQLYTAGLDVDLDDTA
jgi:predicted nucleotide-binding protein